MVWSIDGTISCIAASAIFILFWRANVTFGFWMRSGENRWIWKLWKLVTHPPWSRWTQSLSTCTSHETECGHPGPSGRTEHDVEKERNRGENTSSTSCRCMMPARFTETATNWGEHHWVGTRIGYSYQSRDASRWSQAITTSRINLGPPYEYHTSQATVKHRFQVSYGTLQTG